MWFVIVLTNEHDDDDDVLEIRLKPAKSSDVVAKRRNFVTILRTRNLIIILSAITVSGN